MSDKWKTAAIHWEIHGKKRSAVLAWGLKVHALLERRSLYGGMTSIKECFVILLSPWWSEDSRTFSEKAAIKQEQVVVVIDMWLKLPNTLPLICMNNNSFYCILTRSSENAAKFKRGIQQFRHKGSGTYRTKLLVVLIQNSEKISWLEVNSRCF